VYIREFDRFDKMGNTLCRNTGCQNLIKYQKNVVNNLRNGTTIIFTGIEFVLIYLKETSTHVKFAKRVIPILTEKNLPDHVC
jgi:hypothetical protein